MHVLLDGRSMVGRMTGERTYWLGLIHTLPRTAPDWRFTLALDSAPDASEVPEAENLVVEVVSSPRGRLWPVVVLPRLARQLKADLIHLQYIAPPWLPCPYVTTIHDCSYELFPEAFRRRERWLKRWLVPRTVRRAGAVIGVSETTRTDVLRLYQARPDRVFVAPHGIDPRFEPAPAEAVEQVRAKYRLPERYLLTVGVLQPRKNLIGLVNAYELAHRDLGLDVPLVVVGKENWLYEHISQVIREKGLSEQIRFVGFVPDEELPAVYCGADLFLYGSIYEGFGLPPVEAMACGTAAIVSDAPALVEVTGDAAPHLPPHDAEQWAASIVRLMADEEERARLGQVGLQRARQFTWEHPARVHLAAYAYALNRFAKGSRS